MLRGLQFDENSSAWGQVVRGVRGAVLQALSLRGKSSQLGQLAPTITIAGADNTTTW
jgi:hypothetical protein